MTTIILPSPIDELARATLFDKLLPSTFDKRCGPVCDTKRDGDRLATQIKNGPAIKMEPF